MRLLTRRDALTGMAACAATAQARAAAPFASAQTPGIYRFKLGEFQLTALYDGDQPLPIDDAFIRNAGRAQVEDALALGMLPPGMLPNSFTALLVNTGSKLILIDTGSAGQIADSAGVLNDNLAAAGIKPADIDIILISHFHPDHINGIKTKDGAKVFPNAEIKVPVPEWAFWSEERNVAGASATVRRYFLNARRIFGDLAKDVTQFEPGKEAAAGIGSMPAYGHTPGHTAYIVSSGAASILVGGDTARDPALFVRHPDWQPTFDMDGAAAVTTRKRLLDRAAADRLLVQGYHFPFPSCGHIARRGDGYEFVPIQWKPL